MVLQLINNIIINLNKCFIIIFYWNNVIKCFYLIFINEFDIFLNKIN